jgi:hypothetical protein
MMMVLKFTKHIYNAASTVGGTSSNEKKWLQHMGILMRTTAAIALLLSQSLILPERFGKLKDPLLNKFLSICVMTVLEHIVLLGRKITKDSI